MTSPEIRLAAIGDAEPCAHIFFDAFASIANRHGFPIEPGSPEFTMMQTNSMLSTEGVTGLVAVREGEIVGSGFADERGAIVGIGPVTVDPSVQDVGVGRDLMLALLDRQRERGVAGVRLVQTAYHVRSLSLYAKLGFVVREPLSVFQGNVPRRDTPGYSVRDASRADIDACNAVCRRVHGHDRSAEVSTWVDLGTARVVETSGRISGYATGFGYGWHAVGEGNGDIVALLESADAFLGLGILVPSRNAGLMRWALDSGLRLIQQSTLMTMGLYNEPQGAWLPSIVY
jgi:GNAT superfamily N-acetyltransferase